MINLEEKMKNIKIMETIQLLYEKYKFDYIYINPENINDIDYLYDAEIILIDNIVRNYLGEVKINDSKIRVHYDKKITPGDVIFKYKNIKKERCVKLNNIFK